MDIRRARAEDVGAALEVWRATRAAQGVRPPAGRVEVVRAKLAARDALLVVADDAQVRGFALGEWGRADGGTGDLVPGLLHLTLLCVHPGAQRSGVGAALAEGLADEAYVKGARQLQAWARSGVERSFLLALGLEPTGRTQVTSGAAAELLVGELEPPLRELAVAAGGLRLGQLLKLAGLVDTGAQAKALLEAGGVEVDGEVEHRRGRQLHDGEVVVAHNQAVRVRLPAPGEGRLGA